VFTRIPESASSQVKGHVWTLVAIAESG